MTYFDIKRRYSHLAPDELKRELEYHTTRRNSTHMVGAEECMISAYIVMACHELINEQK